MIATFASTSLQDDKKGRAGQAATMMTVAREHQRRRKFTATTALPPCRQWTGPHRLVFRREPAAHFTQPFGCLIPLRQIRWVCLSSFTDDARCAWEEYLEKIEPSDSSTFEVRETATEARQAVVGHGARYVLAWSLAGVLMAFVNVLVVVFWR
jgi:hypothetical protein